MRVKLLVELIIIIIILIIIIYIYPIASNNKIEIRKSNISHYINTVKLGNKFKKYVI